MECLQILDRARAAEVKGILAHADVARVVPLPLRDMREFVLDHRALSQGRASSGRLDLLTEPLLQRLILSDGDRAPVAEFGGGALRAQTASIADVGIELDHRADRESLALVHSGTRSSGREGSA